MGILYGRAGRLTAKNGGFRPGQKTKGYSKVTVPRVKMLKNEAAPEIIAERNIQQHLEARARKVPPPRSLRAARRRLARAYGSQPLKRGGGLGRRRSARRGSSSWRASPRRGHGAGSNRSGAQGAHSNPLGLFLEPLGLFLRTSRPFVWRVLSAFLRA